MKTGNVTNPGKGSTVSPVDESVELVSLSLFVLSEVMFGEIDPVKGEERAVNKSSSYNNKE